MLCVPTDKTNLDGFEYWLTIFNYQAPCGWSPIPPIEDVMQVSIQPHSLPIHSPSWGPRQFPMHWHLLLSQAPLVSLRPFPLQSVGVSPQA